MPLSNPVAPPALIYATGTGQMPSSTNWGSSNRAVFSRIHVPVPTPIRYFNWVVGVQSGNVQVGVVRLSGVGRVDYTRIVHTGIITCPAAGDIRTDLGLTLLPAGDCALFIWCDNTTAQIRLGNNAGNTSVRVGGQQNTLTTGVLSTGTLTWGQSYIGASLEADV